MNARIARAQLLIMTRNGRSSRYQQTQILRNDDPSVRGLYALKEEVPGSRQLARWLPAGPTTRIARPLWLTDDLSGRGLYPQRAAKR